MKQFAFLGVGLLVTGVAAFVLARRLRGENK